MGYRHFDITARSLPKHPGAVCGDVVETRRLPDATWVVCADGIGSGIRANVAATLCAARLLALAEGGRPMRALFRGAAKSMARVRAPGQPYVAFTMARFLPDGNATILSYDAPPPLLLSPVDAQPLPQLRTEEDGAVLCEANCRLDPGAALVLVSDGVTEAGRGNRMPGGWGAGGLCGFLTDAVVRGADPAAMPDMVNARADALCGDGPRDDSTTVLIRCRRGVVLNILTGPPVDSRNDRALVERFMAMEGLKVVSGGTTASVVERVTGAEIRLTPQSMGTLAPPAHRMDGVDLVTEGAVTMNHAHNILDAPPERYEPNSAATELVTLMRNADRINFIVGCAANQASNDIRFTQQHILPRTTVVPLLKERLEKDGRLVVVEYV